MDLPEAFANDFAPPKKSAAQPIVFPQANSFDLFLFFTHFAYFCHVNI